MSPQEVIKYLEGRLSTALPDRSEAEQHDQGATIVSCMDGRLNQFLRPFRYVIRTAGAVTEPVEGSIGIASEATGVTILATHGDCLAYKAAIEYLAASFAGKRAEGNVVRNLNRNDTRSLLAYINTKRPLNALPSLNDQKALAGLAIGYAVGWTATNRTEKPRVGLFIDLQSVLAPQPHPWVVSYDRLSGPELANFLRAHGMSAPIVATHVLTEPLRPLFLQARR